MHNDDVKHLTCYFWKYEGGCMHSEDRCLYAHHETGKDADVPKRKLPGGPPIAGRNATLESPVYNNWREAKLKVSPEPEEPIVPADVPLFAFIKPRATKKAAATKVAPADQGIIQNAPSAARPSPLTPMLNLPIDSSSGSDGNSKAPAPKSWSQIVGSKPNLPSGQGKGLTLTPFATQIEKVDHAVADFHISDKDSRTTNNPKNIPTSMSAEGHSTPVRRSQRAFSQKNGGLAPKHITSPDVRQTTMGINGHLSGALLPPRLSHSQQGTGSASHTHSHVVVDQDVVINQDVLTDHFKDRAKYPEVLRLMKAPLRSPEDAVTMALIDLRLRLFRPASAPPSLQDLCVLRYKAQQKLAALTRWVQLFREDCADLRARKQPIANDFAAWGAWRVERAENVEGPELRAHVTAYDGEIVARVKQLPGGMFLGSGAIGTRG